MDAAGANVSVLRASDLLPSLKIQSFVKAPNLGAERAESERILI
jgi:hypothetical protein